MRKSKFTEEQIIKLLKEVEAGAKVQDVLRRQRVYEPPDRCPAPCPRREDSS